MRRFGFGKVKHLSWLTGALQLSCMVLAGLAGSAAWAAPANDNFANAQPLLGDFGSVTNDTTSATVESGEPSHAGVTPKNTIWYQWRASTDGPVEFDTFNSGFDTVLAVYIGGTVSTSLQTLNLVVANDDINNYNPENARRGGNTPYQKNPYLGPSGVKFNAVRGQLYYIAVGGNPKDNSDPGKGQVILSWAYHPSGVFRFSNSLYYCTEAESDDPPDGSVAPSARGCRLTINRLFGSSGRAMVRFVIRPVTAVEDINFKQPATNVVIFENHETSKSIIIPVIDDSLIGIRDINPGRIGFPVCPDGFTYLDVVITSVVLDSQEDNTVLSPPRLESRWTDSQVYIFDMDTPGGGLGDPLSPTCGVTNGVVNFERSYFRVSEKVGFARLLVYRSIGGDPAASTEIHYTIDSVPVIDPESTIYNIFDLAAGSDYAYPLLNFPVDASPGQSPDFGTTNAPQGRLSVLALDHTGDWNLTNPDGNGCAPGDDYNAHRTLKWDQGDYAPKSILIPIIDDNRTEFNKDIFVYLFQAPGHNQDAELGWNYYCNVTIENDDSPPGALDDRHNRDWDIATDPPNNPVPGTDNFVYSLAIDPSTTNTIIAGNFSTYNATPRYGLARIRPDGQLDTSFDPGNGVPVKDQNNPSFITTVALTPLGKAVIGGNFPSYNSFSRLNIAQVNTDGSLDTTFNPGLGANGTVWAVAVQTNGQVVIGGEFTTVDGYARAHIARLNANGSVDQSFDPGTNGPNGVINAIAIAPDGSMFIGGDFTSVGGQFRHSVAQLSTNGLVVSTFSPVTGCDGPVFALALQPDGKLVVGGAFSQIEFRSRNNVCRYNPDGSLDVGFDPGTGTDDVVYTITLQNDNRILIGGAFTVYNQTRRIGIARLFTTGELDTGFMDTAYNQFAGPHKVYYNPYVDPKDFLYTIGLQSDGKIMIGGRFHYVGGGELSLNVMTNSVAPIDTPPPGVPGFSRAAFRSRWNVARLLGGDSIGPGSTSLLFTNYSVVENMGFLFIKEVRQNGDLGRIESTFSIPPRTGSNTIGIATSGIDYTYNRVNPEWSWSWPGTRSLGDGVFGTNNVATDFLGNAVIDGIEDIYVTVRNISGYQGDRSLPFKLDMPSYADNFYLGGENIPLGAALGPNTTAFLRIQEDDVKPGVIGFANATYSVNENGGSAVVTIVRTNGSTGVVPFRFATTNGTIFPAAFAGVDYVGVTNTITFRDGQTSTNVTIPINNDFIVQQNDRSISLYLANPGNGATLGTLSNAVLFIVDDDFLPGHINFTLTSYQTNEAAPAMIIPVTRSGGNLGVLDVQYATSNLTASAGVNYQPISGTLHWDSGDTTVRYLTVPLINDGLVTANKQFLLTLFNPSVPGALGGRFQSTNTIVNENFYGTLQFSAPTYNVNEDGGYATITVTRTSGTAETLSANFRTIDGNALQSFNYLPTNGTMVFGPGEVSKTFTVPILDDGVQDQTVFGFNVVLSNFSPASSAGNPTTAFINIVDAQGITQPPGDIDTYFNNGAFFNNDVYALALQPDGKIVAAGNFTIVNGRPVNRLTRLTPNGILDESFVTLAAAGANDTVRALVNQTDTRILLAGSFSSINGVARNSIARVNYDGSIDTGFDTGSGADGIIYSLAETFDTAGSRKVLVGGGFSVVNGVARPGIAQLNDDGTIDTGFSVGIGVNGPVFAMAVSPTNTINAGKIVIGGEFSAVNGIARNRLARLNRDGSLDLTFDPGTGANDTVRALLLEPDGKIVVGGSFTNLNGVALNRIARLNRDGSVDSTFQGGAGADNVVYTLALQPDNRILVGGGFTRASGATRNRLTRLMPDGQIDPTINFGEGADDYVAAIAVQPDGRILIGGAFTQFEGQQRLHLARLYGGSMTGSGSFRFELPTYQVDETGTNVLITVLRTGGTSGPQANGTGNVAVDFSTIDGSAVAGVNYITVQTNLVFPPGETVRRLLVPVLDDQQITPDLTVNLALANPTPPSTLGTQPTALLTIFNDECAVSFASATFQRAENSPDGTAVITLRRVGSLRNGATVLFTTTGGGTAVPGVNYTPVTNALVAFGSNEAEQIARVPIIHDPAANGDKTVTMQITDPLGALIVAPSQATLTIVDVDVAAGTFVFSQTNFFVGEGDGYAQIDIIRTNGHSGDVSVTATTLPGDATPGLKYVPTNFAMAFANGETVHSFLVRILEEGQVEGNQNLFLLLTNATGGAAIGAPNPVPLTIIDDDVGVSFSTNSAQNAVYIVSETNTLVTVDVYRLNAPTNLVTTVSYYTTNGTASAGVDYQASSGTLTFNPGESHKSISLVIQRNPQVTGDLTFGVRLVNPTPGVQIASPSTANVIINDVDTGLSFAGTNSASPVLYSVRENGTNITLTVVRTNANTGPVTVTYTTEDGTAVGSIDYLSVSGLLVFTNGQLSNSFSIPIIDNKLVDGDRFFTVSLVGVTAPGQLLSPSSAKVTIIDNETGFSLSSGAYDVAENGVSSIITVQRTGFTNGTASVSFATRDGSAVAGRDYTATNGVLTFGPGEISKSFAVGVVDNTVIDGDRTVIIALSNPQGSAAILSPGAATLTIHDNDGSLIIPAGAALIAESFSPPNQVIENGERVSLLFAFRNSAGSNTVNLTATLLATNGVSSPSGPQSYGVLVAKGASISRQFDFTASGTNGQRISAMFQLSDLGHPVSTNAGLVIFTFTIGTSTASASNSGVIRINDDLPATPYPSILTAGGIDGLISKVTMSISNFNHTAPSDVDALLVSPNGQSSLIMANAGAGPATRLNFAFDDAAGSMISQSSQITSGTFKPSVYYPVAAFPVPAPPAPSGGRYTNALATFNGGNPNGNWSLYIIDDTFQDFGAISNGWRLDFTLVNPVIASADVGITMAGSPPSLVIGSNVSYTISAVNYGPGAAANVTITDTLPVGSQFVSANSSIGTLATNGAGQLTWTIGAMAKDASASMTLTVLPTTVGAITNTAVASASSVDLNNDDDQASVVTTIIGQSADLAIGVSGSPAVLMVGQDLTYSIVVSNLGPGSADNVAISDRLPVEVEFVSAVPPAYILNGSTVNFTNLGTLGRGQLLTATVVVRPVFGGLITNTVNCVSTTLDPVKLNNTAAIKSTVQLMQVTFLRSGNTLYLGWPAQPAGFVMETATDLSPASVWTPITNGISTVNGQNILSIPIGTGNEFFRLRAAP